MTQSTNLILPGTTVTIDGKEWTVGAVGYVGERYYWLTDKQGGVFMCPATIVEAAT